MDLQYLDLHSCLMFDKNHSPYQSVWSGHRRISRQPTTVSRFSGAAGMALANLSEVAQRKHPPKHLNAGTVHVARKLPQSDSKKSLDTASPYKLKHKIEDRYQSC